MDPFTQGALGAALPQATAVKNPRHMRIAGGLGFLAGMAADLDVFIRSSTDPLAFLTYHRHFTHSLIFIPLGGFITALVLHWVFGRRWDLTFRQTFLFCVLGYATHALLDAATSYGTLLLWPFSDERISWSIIAVIDPLFTLPMAALVFISARLKRPLYARLALAWGALYLGTAVLQHNAALDMGKQIATARGHDPVRLEVKPSFGNILVWKTIYEAEGRYYVDGVRAGIAPRVFYGESLPTLDVARDMPWLDANTQQARDIARFSTFSQGFVAQDPQYPNRIIDIRYSFIPNDIRPLWSIELSPEAAPDAHAPYLTHRAEARAHLRDLWRMMVGP
jgi:inner membrane protein